MVVEVLLIYSLGYATWRQWRRQHAAPFARLSRSAADARPSSPGRTLVAIAAGVSLVTILVRPVFPFLSGQIGQLKLWQWPQYLAMFGLGSSQPATTGSIPYPIISAADAPSAPPCGCSRPPSGI